MKVYAVFGSPRNSEGYLEEPKSVFKFEEHANAYANTQALATGNLYHVGELEVNDTADAAKFPTKQVVMEGWVRLGPDKSVINSEITRSYFNHPDAHPQPELRIDVTAAYPEYRDYKFSEIKNVEEGESFDSVSKYIVQSVADKIAHS